MNMLILFPAEIAADGTTEISDWRFAHLRDVTRPDSGARLRAGLVHDATGCVEVISLTGTSARLRWMPGNSVPPAPRVDLLLALPRPKVMKRLWSQLSALGVGRIDLVNAEQVQRDYFDSHVLKPDFYQRQLLEGLQQTGHTWLPQVAIHKELKPWMEDQWSDPDPGECRLVAEPEATCDLPSAIASRRPRRVVLAVGPEGGWTGHELGLLGQAHFVRVSLGQRTLRSDTACIALVATTTALLEADTSGACQTSRRGE